MMPSVIHIAYSAADQPAALKLWRELDRLGCNATLGAVTIDESGVAQAPHIAENITHLILLASQYSADDLSVSQTLDGFLKTRPAEKVLPVWMKASDNKDDEQSYLNPILRYMREQDDGLLRSRDDIAPSMGAMDQEGAQTIARRIVAQFRPSSGTFKSLNPIFAPIRQSPMPWGAAGIAAAAAVIFGVWGLGQYQLAESEALQAHLARQASRQMLANLDDTLSSSARREVFLRLSEDVFALTEQDNQTSDSVDLSRQSGLLHIVGEARKHDGDLEGALIAYRRAADITEQLLNDAPDSPDAIYDHAQSVFWIGDAAMVMGDFDTARDYFEDYADLANQLVAIDANNPVYQGEWAYSQANLGSVSMGRNEREAALRYLDNAIEGYQNGPIDAGIVSRRSLANAYGWRSGPLRGLGRIEDAIASREMQLEIAQSLVREDPQNQSHLTTVVSTMLVLADMRLDLGQIDLAEAGLDAISPTIRELYEAYPESRLIRRKYIETELTRAQIALYRGDITRAQLLHSTAARAYTSGEGAEFEDGRRIDLGVFELMRARIALASEAYEPALTAALQSAAEFEADLSEEGTRFRHLAAFARFYAGEALDALGRPGEAQREWRRALAEIELIDAPRDLRAEDVYARILFRLGETDNASGLSQNLRERGYARIDFVAFWGSPNQPQTVENTQAQEDDDG